MEPTKAQSVVTAGLVTESWAPAVLADMSPPPRAMMAKAAPNAAPWDTPMVEAEARGLRRIPCMTQPTMPRPNPATMAVTARGRRRFKTMMFSFCPPWPKRVASTRSRGTVEEPKAMANRNTSTVNTRRAKTKSRFRPMKERYSWPFFSMARSMVYAPMVMGPKP